MTQAQIDSIAERCAAAAVEELPPEVEIVEANEIRAAVFLAVRIWIVPQEGCDTCGGSGEYEARVRYVHRRGSGLAEEEFRDEMVACEDCCTADEEDQP